MEIRGQIWKKSVLNWDDLYLTDLKEEAWTIHSTLQARNGCTHWCMLVLFYYNISWNATCISVNSNDWEEWKEMMEDWIMWKKVLCMTAALSEEETRTKSENKRHKHKMTSPCNRNTACYYYCLIYKIKLYEPAMRGGV